MSTTSDSSTNTSGAVSSQINDKLKSELASADDTTLRGIQNAKLIHQARLTGLSRTAASLKAQYPATDTRVVSAQDAVNAATTTIGRISIFEQQLATTKPQVASAGWAIHGRVFTADMKPSPQCTVYLVDAQKTYQQALGFAYTDSSGYFVINYTGTGYNPPTGTQLFVEVADQKGQPISLSNTPFQPTVGNAFYQNILLAPGAQPLGDPPAAIKSAAIPAKAAEPSSATPQ